MKVEITYQKNSDVDAPCIARAEVAGEPIVAMGRTWEGAKARLMEKLDAYLNFSAPPPEQVEIKMADEEMQTELIPMEAIK
jgi:hypothetical protein